jgi:DNA-binding response OmpR family regulator
MTAAQSSMEDPHLLVVDDDERLRSLLHRYLTSNGYRVTAAADAADARALMKSMAFDLLVLDVMMPGESGFELTKSLRSHSQVPILMLTARGEEADRGVGLEMGADDYVTKPFSPRELGARVKALLRRTEPANEPRRVIEARGLTIDPSSYRVARDSKPVTLSTLEFRLLYYLATRPNRVFTRDQLLDAVWGTERFVTPRSVDVYIRRLREKVEVDADHPAFLKTVRGAGYMFESEGPSEKQE